MTTAISLPRLGMATVRLPRLGNGEDLEDAAAAMKGDCYRLAHMKEPL